MGEREKGHEWVRLTDGIGKMHELRPDIYAETYKTAAHPSAGQSDASLEQELVQAAGRIMWCGFLVSAVRELREFLDKRLAESRAAMREEAAKVVEQYDYELIHEFNELRDRPKLVERIRSLPADSSALNARDARPGLNLRDRVARAIYDYDRGNPALGLADTDSETVIRYYGMADAALAQRSAEKGKAEVKYECGCPPRFRIDPKEGKQYEAYCSQHHKPLRRSAEGE